MAIEAGTILDSCVLINLAASEEIEEIVQSIDGAVFICTAARNEAIFLRDESDPAVPVPLDLENLLSVASISICDLATEDEEEQFVRLASELDDGEAMSIAIAESRGMNFASDDQKARRIFMELVPSAERLSCTSSIVRRWAEGRFISRARLKDVLHRIEVRARFTPSWRDPNAAWWKQSAA